MRQPNEEPTRTTGPSADAFMAAAWSFFMLLGIEFGHVLKSVKVTTRPRRESTSTTCWFGLQNRNVGRLLVRGRFASPNAAMVASAAAAASAARFLQPDIAAWSQNRLMRARRNAANAGNLKGSKLAQLRVVIGGRASDSTFQEMRWWLGRVR